MTKTEISFVPHSDMELEDVSVVLAHKNLIGNNHLGEATALLEQENYQKGYRAALFRSIEQKLQTIQLHLLNKGLKEIEEYISDTEPTSEEIGERAFWVSPY